MGIGSIALLGLVFNTVYKPFGIRDKEPHDRGVKVEHGRLRTFRFRRQGIDNGAHAECLYLTHRAPVPLNASPQISHASSAGWIENVRMQIVDNKSGLEIVRLRVLITKNLSCLTSKMSHGGKWRGACESMIRDGHGHSLHRVVRPIMLFGIHTQGGLRDILGNGLSAGVLRDRARTESEEAKWRAGRGGSVDKSNASSSRGFWSLVGGTAAIKNVWVCLTSKMSHGGKWRRSCASTNCDIYRSWLHRLVRLIFHSVRSCRAFAPSKQASL